MSKWTHAICEGCWKKHNPNRVPIQFLLAEEEKCCFCGNITTAGIYIRHDPKELPCKGIHNDGD